MKIFDAWLTRKVNIFASDAVLAPWYCMGRESTNVRSAQERILRAVGHIYGKLSCGISPWVTNGRDKFAQYHLKGGTQQQAEVLRIWVSFLQLNSGALHFSRDKNLESHNELPIVS